jgi:hypothetical protein
MTCVANQSLETRKVKETTTKELRHRAEYVLIIIAEAIVIVLAWSQIHLGRQNKNLGGKSLRG